MKTISVVALLSLAAQTSAYEKVSADCTKKYVVGSLNRSYKIAQEFNITEQELKELNPYIVLGVELFNGMEFCLSKKAQATCTKYHEAKGDRDTCADLTRWYGISRQNLERLNGNLNNCEKSFKSGTKICVSEKAQVDCKHTHLTFGQYYSYPKKLAELYNVTEQDILTWNDHLESGKYINQGREICVGLKEINCKNKIKSGYAYDSCAKINAKFGIKEEDLYRLNNNMICDPDYNWVSFKEVCISGDREPVTCKQRYTVKRYDQCSDLADVFKTTEQDLKTMNENLDCTQKIPQGRDLCVGQKEIVCKERFEVYWPFDYCWKIADKLDINVKDIQRLNQNINCETSFRYGSTICVRD